MNTTRQLSWLLAALLFPCIIWGQTCPTPNLSSSANTLTIGNLIAPLEIVKVFDADYNILFECNGDCPNEVTVDNLATGRYEVEVQNYTASWQPLCTQREAITVSAANTNNPSPTPAPNPTPTPPSPPSTPGLFSCQTVAATIAGDRLELTGINAPHVIINVFDVFYNLIFTCFDNCGSEVVVTDLLAGSYNVEMQFYDAAWRPLCTIQEAVTVGTTDAGTPCDESACRGTIVLSNQAALDAFCGCTTITGDLIVGSSGGSDIQNVSTLRTVERVTGTVQIVGIQSDDLDGLGNLNRVGNDLIISGNARLRTLSDLFSLSEIGRSLILRDNRELKDLRGLNAWVLTPAVYLIDLPRLDDITKLAQLRNLSQLTLISNPKLKTVPTLVEVDRLRLLDVRNNGALENLDFLELLNRLEGAVTIQNNAALDDCCGLYHLIDGDDSAGSSSATLRISGNPMPCSSVPDVLAECGATAPVCANVTATARNGRLNIEGLNADIDIVKVFDGAFNEVFSCQNNCGDAATVPNLRPGTYEIVVNFYTANWSPLCERTITITLDANGNGAGSRARNGQLPDVVSAFPNPASDQLTIRVDERLADDQPVRLRLVSPYGQTIWQRTWNETNAAVLTVDLQNWTNGLYLLEWQQGQRRRQSQKVVVNNWY